MTYRNRITERRMMKARDLMDNEGNWRLHPSFQVDSVGSLLGAVGIAAGLTAYYSERQGGLTLLNGHLRKGLDPDQEWPVDILDVDDAEADLLLSLMDPLTGLAQAHKEKTAALLQRLQVEAPVLQQRLAELADQAGLYQDDEDDGDEKLPDPLDGSDLEGWGQEARRVIVVFESAEEEAEFWQVVEHEPKPNKVVYKWGEIRGDA